MRKMKVECLFRAVKLSIVIPWFCDSPLLIENWMMSWDTLGRLREKFKILSMLFDKFYLLRSSNANKVPTAFSVIIHCVSFRAKLKFCCCSIRFKIRNVNLWMLMLLKERQLWDKLNGLMSLSKKPKSYLSLTFSICDAELLFFLLICFRNTLSGTYQRKTTYAKV